MLGLQTFPSDKCSLIGAKRLTPTELVGNGKPVGERCNLAEHSFGSKHTISVGIVLRLTAELIWMRRIR